MIAGTLLICTVLYKGAHNRGLPVTANSHRSLLWITPFAIYLWAQALAPSIEARILVLAGYSLTVLVIFLRRWTFYRAYKEKHGFGE